MRRVCYVLSSGNTYPCPGEKITSDILNYIAYCKEKGCFLTGTEDLEINNINVVVNS